MLITGVTPLPAVRNSSFGGTGRGSTNQPSGWVSRRSTPGAILPTRCGETAPSGTALTVIVMQPSPRSGADESEYERQSRTPSTSTPTPTPTYCPAR